ncbi:MAG: hypothetical protein ACQEW8_10755 [Actinomycetota bacterium]
MRAKVESMEIKMTSTAILAEPQRERQTAADLPLKERESIVFSRESYTREELAFAEKEKTERLETRYVLTAKQRDATFRTPDGHSFRCAGDLYLRVCRDGARRFVAYVHKDSVHHDFKYFDRVINDAKFGRMSGWERHTFKDGTEGWWFNYPNYQIDGLKDFKPANVLIEEPSASPNLEGFGSSWGYPCNESRCREKYHEDDDGNHVLEVLGHDLTTRGSYEIEIRKDAMDPDSAWYLNVWTNGDLCELSAEQAARFANDLSWMSIECQTANAKGNAS